MPQPTIGQRIRAARRARKMTQQQLADAIRMGRVAVARWETNKQAPLPIAIAALNRELGIEL